jgi:transcriptional regulator with XRE-family HTH domain
MPPPNSPRLRHEAVEHAAGQIFRQQREALGLSQSDLARALRSQGFALNQSQVGKCETGKRPLRVAEASAWAHVLTLPLAAALGAVDASTGDGVHELRARLHQFDRETTELRDILGSTADRLRDIEIRRAEVLAKFRGTDHV